MKTRISKMEGAGWHGKVGTSLSAAARRGLRALPLRLGVSAVTLAACFGALAQYAINWHTTDGGGGTSTNEEYSVSGTIGQPDAGPVVSGGQYAVTGGFWALPQALQMPGAPVLNIIAASPGYASISWTPASPGWVLQENSNLSTTNWVNSATGTNNPAIVPATLPTKFYRLFKP